MIRMQRDRLGCIGWVTIGEDQDHQEAADGGDRRHQQHQRDHMPQRRERHVRETHPGSRA